MCKNSDSKIDERPKLALYGAYVNGILEGIDPKKCKDTMIDNETSPTVIAAAKRAFFVKLWAQDYENDASRLFLRISEPE